MENEAATKQDLHDLRHDLRHEMDVRFKEHTELIITELTGVIHDVMDRFDERFNRLEARMDKLELRMTAIEERMAAAEERLTTVEASIRNLDERLAAVEGRLAAVEDDIKELYHLVKETRNKYDAQLKKQSEQEERLRRLEVFAGAAAQKLGIRLT